MKQRSGHYTIESDGNLPFLRCKTCLQIELRKLSSERGKYTKHELKPDREGFYEGLTEAYLNLLLNFLLLLAPQVRWR